MTHRNDDLVALLKQHGELIRNLPDEQPVVDDDDDAVWVELIASTGSEARLHLAMTAVVDTLAGTTSPLDVTDRASVARQAVSLAAAFADLAAQLGIRPPAFVVAALA